MPITKSGRYSMNPAYAEALERAAEEERNAKNGNSGGDDSADGSDGDGDNADAAPRQAGPGSADEKTSQKNRPVKRIEIEPAENGGFVSRTERQQPDDGDSQEACGHGGWAPPYEEPELRAHPDGEQLLSFLGQELKK
jgi:hypothetical protein